MAHWRNGSVFQTLRHFGRYGVRSARVTQPSGPIQQIENLQGADTPAGGLFPVQPTKNIQKLSGKARLRNREGL